MAPLAEREIAGATDHPPFVARAAEQWLAAVPRRLPDLDIDGYIGLATRGSFPDLALRPFSDRQRVLWLASYLDDLVTRDVEMVDTPRDPTRLRRYVTALALNLAGQPSDVTLARDAAVTEHDLLINLGRGRLFAFEFKAGAAPTTTDARHLTWLRDQLGDQFVGGIVLHAGQAVTELGDRIAAVPLSALWTPP